MKTNNTRHIVAIALMSFAGIAFAQAEPPVRVKTEGMSAQLKQRVEEKAAQGQSALIRYINSTKHIHALRVEEIVLSEQPANAAKSSPAGETKVAAKGAPQK